MNVPCVNFQYECYRDTTTYIDTSVGTNKSDLSQRVVGNERGVECQFDRIAYTPPHSRNLSPLACGTTRGRELCARGYAVSPLYYAPSDVLCMIMLKGLIARDR